MRCWNMIGGWVEQCSLRSQHPRFDRKTEAAAPGERFRAPRRPLPSESPSSPEPYPCRNCGWCRGRRSSLLHRAQLCGLLVIQRAHQILEVLVEEIVPDHPFDAIAVRRAEIGIAGRRVGARRGDKIEHTHCRSPSSTLSRYLVAQLRIAATSCVVGFRVCASADDIASADKTIAGPPHRVFSKISRPISMRRISLVPAPIS